MHKFDLTNRTSIITGGAQGFGLDIAKKFLNSGAKAIIWDIDENELIEASKNLNNPFVSKYMNTLKNSIPEFIKKDKIKNKIISTLPALPGDGGSGAFYILIKKKN